METQRDVTAPASEPTTWSGGVGGALPLDEAGAIAADPPLAAAGGDDPEATAARADVLSHWADEDLGAREAVSQLASEVAGLDREAALEKLEALGGKKKADAAARGAEDEAKLEGRRKPRSGSASHGAPPDREALAAEVWRRSEVELAQLDATLAEHLVEAERRYSAHAGELEGEVLAQLMTLSSRTVDGDDELAGEMKQRQREHQKQIDGEEQRLEAGAAVFDKPLGEQGQADGDRAMVEAEAHARRTRAQARRQADDARTAARLNAHGARTVGETKALSATAAAEQSARAADEAGRVSDGVQIRVLGAQRAVSAKVEAQRTAREIEEAGEQSAATILEKGEHDAEAQLQRGREAADRARDEARAGTLRVGGAVNQARTSMVLRSSAAVAEMDAQRKSVTAGAKVTIGVEAGNMDRHRVEARRQAEVERAAAVRAMRERHDEARAAIVKQRVGQLARIARTPASGLARLGGRLSRELRGMETTAEEAGADFERRADAEERRIEEIVKTGKKRIRKAAGKAVAAIETFIARARKSFARIDKPTAEAIADAAKAGQAAIIGAGSQALVDTAEANAGDRADLAGDAATEQGGLTEELRRAVTDGAAAAGGVAQAIDERLVADAMAETEGALSTAGTLEHVSDEEAGRVLNVLASLPPNARAQALDELSADQIETLTAEVEEIDHDENRGLELGGLAEVARDPKEKLLLWGGSHKARARFEARQLEEDEGSLLDGDEAAEARNEHRAAAAETTAAEIDEEIEYLRQTGRLTAADVADLEARKELELDVEMRHAVNLTSEEDTRSGGSKVVWDPRDLVGIDDTLGRLPADTVGGNPDLEEIRRVDERPGRPRVAGDHHDGVVRLFDPRAPSTAVAGGAMRMAGKPRQGPGAGAGPVSALDEIVTHELGHNVHDAHEDAFELYKAAAGWREGLDADDLREAGIGDADIVKMQQVEDTQPGYEGQHRVEGSDGKMYMVDPYSGDFLAVDRDAMPEDPSGFARGPWGYAHSNPSDTFAEHYAMATHRPEQLHEDLVADPQAQMAATQAVIDALTVHVAAAKAHDPDADISALEEELAARTQVLGQQQATALKRSSMFHIMRDEVLNTDERVAELVATLEEKGIDPETFREEAAKLSTPEQVEALARQHGA